jgi:hypothetical protein
MKISVSSVCSCSSFSAKRQIAVPGKGDGVSEEPLVQKELSQAAAQEAAEEAETAQSRDGNRTGLRDR